MTAFTSDVPSRRSAPRGLIIVALLGALALAIGLAVVGSVLAVNAENKANKLDSQVATLRHQLAATRPVDLSGIKADLSGIKADLSGVQSDLSSAKSDLVGINTRGDTTAKAVTHIKYCLPELN